MQGGCDCRALGQWEGDKHPRGKHGRFGSGQEDSEQAPSKEVKKSIELLSRIGVEITAPVKLAPPAKGPNYGGPDGYTQDGSIYIVPGTNHYGDDVARAGILAHEQYHIDNGPEEGPAYDQQLDVLRQLGAKSSVIQDVERARDSVVNK